MPRFLLWFSLVLSCKALAYESDQFNYRLLAVKDSLTVMDKRVNAGLDEVIKHWRKGEDTAAFVRAAYFKLGGLYWAGKIERWAGKSAQVEKYPYARYHSIYSGLAPWATRVTFFMGVGPTFRLNGQMVGTDKLGHFFSQGYSYYKRDARGLRGKGLYGNGVFVERWIFGTFTTGVYSNADLVANYEGMLFYQSLFNGDVIPGKPAIITWQQGKPVRHRDFTWRDHINEYWDEALNPSYLIKPLQKRIRKRIAALCPDYQKNRKQFTPQHRKALDEKYRAIGLRPEPENLFSAVCAVGW